MAKKDVLKIVTLMGFLVGTEIYGMQRESWLIQKISELLVIPHIAELNKILDSNNYWFYSNNQEYIIHSAVLWYHTDPSQALEKVIENAKHNPRLKLVLSYLSDDKNFLSFVLFVKSIH